MAARVPLDVDLVVAAAVAVADRGGLSDVSMRKVGQQLGVEAMSLYHHVRNKDDLLDRLAEWVFASMRRPAVGEPWRHEMAVRAASQRDVLGAHPWAVALIESRSSPGEATLAYHDAVLGCLLADGFSMPLAAHAFSVLDAYVFGFVVTESRLPFEPVVGAEAFAEGLALPADRYPHLAAFLETFVFGGAYDYADEFEVGLEIILDELERRRRREGDQPSTTRASR